LVIYAGLIYDLTTEKVGYYSSNSDYLQIVLTDSTFYYLYILPFVLIYFASYIWGFFVSLEKKKGAKKTS
jgi:hypothetical protein